MKKRSTRQRDDLRPEYDFDYSKSRPNPYAARLRTAARQSTNDVVLVSLEPDVAKAFPSAKAVNGALRAAMKKTKPSLKTKSRTKAALRSSAA